jgi:phosphatidylinositol 4-phosphatase
MSLTSVAVYEKKIVIEGGSACLALDRDDPSDTSIEVLSSAQVSECRSQWGSESKRIESRALLGIVQLVASRYVLAVTDCELVGNLENDAAVHRVKAVSIVCVSNANANSSSSSSSLLSKNEIEPVCDDAAAELYFVRLLEAAVASEFLYFSFDLDLTHSMQRRAELLSSDSDSDSKTPSTDWRHSCAEFFWNWHASEPLRLTDGSLDDWVVPFVMGFVSVSPAGTSVNGSALRFGVASRRSVHRVGTRFNRRGVDEHGHPANFVESEQMVFADGGETRMSFVQARGSAPFYWTQPATVKYSPASYPRPSLPANQSLAAFKRHFGALFERYGERVAVANLIDSDGREQAICDGYTRHVEQSGDARIDYFPFDFHHECAKMRYDNLDKLIGAMQPSFDAIGYFEVRGADIVRRQAGVVRTNCMDNLDRTNVVQTKFAEHVLNGQLRALRALEDGQRVDVDRKFHFGTFKAAWADNGDAISKQYSGTGALKNDFTRTGKRDWKGMLNDGQNSLTRYFLNNFRDGFRQDSLDLFVGNVNVHSPSVLAAAAAAAAATSSSSGAKIIALRIVLVVAALILVTTLLAPVGAATGRKTAALLFWLVALAFAFNVMHRFGSRFVDRPRLCSGPLLD